MTTVSNFSDRVLIWFQQSGRKDLPWQHSISPYRVWVSEIMLQQTQVGMVIRYFERFVEEIPSVEDLANTPEDKVLHLWTGLGYYARARNLHKAAKQIVEVHQGQFPNTVDELCSLPGIGRSTAGAIRSIAFKQPAAILDGNVKRVLARWSATPGWPGQTRVHKQLWAIAEQLTPKQHSAHYSQAMMDLGATLCTRSNPQCHQCPVAGDCLARASNTPLEYPGKKPRKSTPVKAVRMLMLENPAGDILLRRRPPQGIWGGLWGFPEVESERPLDQFLLEDLNIEAPEANHWPELRHTFSHFHLDITPIHVQLSKHQMSRLSVKLMESGQELWYNIAQPEEVGLAAPIAGLLKTFAKA